jgi:hypothetical protein
MTILLYIVLLSMGPCEGVKIDYKLDGISPDYLQLTPDSLLISQVEKIVEFTMEGQFIKEFTFESDTQSPWEITSYSYIKGRDLIAVNLGRVVSRDEAGRVIETEYRLRFFNRDDPSYSIQGFDKIKDPNIGTLDAYYRQIISTNGRLFVNQWTRENIEKDAPLLVEVKLTPYNGGYAFEAKSEPFEVQRREMEKWSAKFKKRWVVSQEDLIVLDEMQPMLKNYSVSKTNSKRGMFESGDEELLELPGWIQPYKPFDRNARARWAFSFSRNVGLYELGDGLVSGYVTPNKKHEFYGREGKGESSVSPWVLNLQRMKANGENIGSRVIIEGGLLAGVQDQAAWVVKTDGTLCQISF